MAARPRPQTQAVVAQYFFGGVVTHGFPLSRESMRLIFKGAYPNLIEQIPLAGQYTAMYRLHTRAVTLMHVRYAFPFWSMQTRSPKIVN